MLMPVEEASMCDSKCYRLDNLRARAGAGAEDCGHVAETRRRSNGPPACQDTKLREKNEGEIS